LWESREAGGSPAEAQGRPLTDALTAAAQAPQARTHTRLRRLCADDAAFLLELLNQPSWLEFIGDRNVRTPTQARDYVGQRIDAQFGRYGYGMWGVELREQARPPTHDPRQPAMSQRIGLRYSRDLGAPER